MGMLEGCGCDRLLITNVKSHVPVANIQSTFDAAVPLLAPAKLF